MHKSSADDLRYLMYFNVCLHHGILFLPSILVIIIIVQNLLNMFLYNIYMYVIKQGTYAKKYPLAYNVFTLYRYVLLNKSLLA